MTIRSLIDRVQKEKPNTFTDEDLLVYINDIECETCEELEMEFKPYTTDDYNEELLVPEPYSRLYISYVKAMIDYANEEYASYQLNQEQHTMDYRDFVNWVVRTGQNANHYVPKKVRNIM